MGTVETALLMELVVVPVVKELLIRRGLHGVGMEDIKKIRKDPVKVLSLLKNDTSLHIDVVQGVADTLDNIAGDAIDPVVELLKKLKGSDGSDES